MDTYQVFDQVLQLLLSLTDSFLSPYDGDQLLLRVVRRRENDSGSCLVTHTADVYSSTTNQEFVVLWFGLQLSCKVVDLLKKVKI